jgi:hypothetical protein
MLGWIKNLEILEKPEVTFKRQLIKNPFYPFEKTDENRKLCHVRQMFFIKTGQLLKPWAN